MKLNLFRSKASEVAAIVDYCKTSATQEMDEFLSKMPNNQVVVDIPHNN